VSTGPRSPVRAAVAAVRPRQWLKNALVFAAPLAAGALLEVGVLVDTMLAFVAFCLVSSATYLLNDLRDVEADRAHPRKRLRPIAAGDLSQPVAGAMAVVLGGAGLLVGFLTSAALGWVLVAYLVMTVAYTLYLKNEPVIDLLVIALGFLLRAIAGGAASGIAISNWFLIVAGFGSLFMAAGKRYSELERVRAIQAAGDDPGPVRRSLEGYTPAYLRFVWAIAASVTITAYCLWTFEVASGTAIPWALLSVLPFVLGLFRYAIDIDSAHAEAPEEVVLGDPVLIATGVVWVALFVLNAWAI
jgi:decaprenyl-phosphate phosphoribosyltransferase